MSRVSVLARRAADREASVDASAMWHGSGVERPADLRASLPHRRQPYPRGPAPLRAGVEPSVGGFAAQVPARGTSGTRRRVGWIAAVAAVAWFTTLIVEYRFGLFPDQRTGVAVGAAQMVFLGSMAGWAVALVLMLRGRVVTGRFAWFALGWQCAGLVGLVTMGLLTLNSGTQESPVFPIAGLSMILGGVPPTFAAESTLPLAWFVVGIAMVLTSERKAKLPR